MPKGAMSRFGRKRVCELDSVDAQIHDNARVYFVLWREKYGTE